MKLVNKQTLIYLFKKFFTLMILILSIINVKLPMFTFIANSGYIYMYVSEIIMFILILFFIYKVIKKDYLLNDKEKKLLYIIIAFLIFYVILTFFRYILNYNFKDSIFALKISIFPVFLFYIPRFLKIDKYDIIMNLIFFHFIINIFQIQYFQNIRFSPFLENIMIYLTVSISLICINFYALFNLKKNKYLCIKYFVLIFNIIFSMICVFFSGSRISIFALFLLVFFSIIYLLFFNWKFAGVTFGLFAVSFALAIIIPTYNKSVISNLDRAIGFKNIFVYSKTETKDEQLKDLDLVKNDDNIDISKPINDDNIDISKPINDGNYGDVKYDDDFTKNERIKSDNIRKYLIKCAINNIKRSPIIGYGTYTFEYNDGGGIKYQSAHNFILEYLCLYGIIGTLIYSLIAIFLIKNYIFKEFEHIKFFIAISLFLILIHSLVQPTMLNVIVVYTFWSLLSLLCFSKENNLVS